MKRRLSVIAFVFAIVVGSIRFGSDVMAQQQCDHGYKDGTTTTYGYCVRCDDGSTAVQASACPGGKDYDADSTPNKGPSAGILTDCAEQAKNGKNGEGIICILSLVLTVMTYGVGIFGVLGIMIAGIQYATSQGDPTRMAKAKNRILQVVIGLVIYAVMWAALRFLVPGFGITSVMGGDSVQTSTSNSSSKSESENSPVNTPDRKVKENGCREGDDYNSKTGKCINAINNSSYPPSK